MTPTGADELFGRLDLGPGELVKARLDPLVQVLDALLKQAPLLVAQRADDPVVVLHDRQHILARDQNLLLAGEHLRAVGGNLHLQPLPVVDLGEQLEDLGTQVDVDHAVDFGALLEQRALQQLEGLVLQAARPFGEALAHELVQGVTRLFVMDPGVIAHACRWQKVRHIQDSHLLLNSSPNGIEIKWH